METWTPERKEETIPRESYPAIGFDWNMTIEDARARASQINKQNQIEARKINSAARRVKDEQEVISAYLPENLVAGFENEPINMTALWRPHCKEIVDRIELYKHAKQSHFSYGFLTKNLEAWLKPNFGTIIYHEDLIKVISEFTGWDFARSNALRRILMRKNAPEVTEQNQDWVEFKNLVPKEIVDFVAEESKWAFCLPHAIAFAKFTKQTAILKSLHKDIYYAEIAKFEQKHSVTWDDIGIRMNGVSLHQG